MNIKEYCQKLHNTKKSFAFYAQIRKDGKESEIIEKTSFLNDNRLSTRVYCILYDIKKQPICECGKELRFTQYSIGFRKFCSTKCSANSKTKQEKIKETNLKKYGCINAFQTDAGRNGWNEFQSDKDRVKTAVNKGKETLKNTYGVDTIEEAQRLRMEKALQVNIDKYGFAYNNREQANKNRNEEEMVKALEKTCLEKYGVEYYMQVPEIFNKVMSKVYKKKKFIFPSGKSVLVQGYEPLALNDLISYHDETDIITESSEMPKIWYIGTDNKKHRYYPDIYIPKDNKIIEVKSDYTMQADYDKNKLKEKACISAGFNFEFMIYDGKGNQLPS